MGYSYKSINDIMKELIPKRLQTENLSSTHIYVCTGQGTIPVVFPSRFTQSYSTRFRESNFSEKSFKFNQTKF